MVVARFALRRVAAGILTLVGVTFLTYLMLDWSIDGGAGSVVLGACPRDAVEGPCGEIIDKYRLDDPVVVRYVKWLGDAVTGDLNETQRRNQADVMEIILDKAPITTQLAATAIILAVIVAVPLGVFGALRADRPAGQATSALVQVLQTLPVFVTGLLLIWLFAEQWGVLPASGWTRLTDSVSGNLEALALPAITLAMAEVGAFARVVRADLVETMNAEFVQAARAKGLPTRQLMFRHVLRPSSLGLLTVVGLNASSLMGGALIVEIVFGLGGIGPELFDAILARDIYLTVGMTAYVGLVYVVLSTLVDVIYGWIDPRIDVTTGGSRAARF